MSSSRSRAVTVGLLVIGALHAIAVTTTDDDVVYLLGWPLLAAAALAAGFASPRHWAAWGVVALVPLGLVTVFGDLVIEADDRGTGAITLFIVVVQAFVATGAALMGAQLAQLGATRGVRSASGRGVTVALGLLAVGTALAAVLRLTTDAPDNDPFESELFWWLWIVLPVVAAAAGAAFSKLSAWWGFVAVVPLLVLIFVDGRVLYDGVGASFWAVDSVIAGLLGTWATLFSVVGGSLVRRRPMAVSPN